MKCPSCGASFPKNDSVCEYCGTLRPAEPVSHPPSKADIFRRIRESPQFAEKNQALHLQKNAQADPVPSVVIGLLLLFGCITAFVMAVILLNGLSDLGPLSVGMFVVVFVFALTQFFKAFEVCAGPVKCFPVIVIGKRSKAGGAYRASMSYFITLEFEDGQREEFPIYAESLYGRISVEDAGILFLRGHDEVEAAFLRSRYVADFERVQISSGRVFATEVTENTERGKKKSTNQNLGATGLWPV
ncbi:DUF2500 family protein [Blastopirellula marina]|uniref:Uncharacterized protein n=1 Tax=Blastopirellula marina TaxID=124 RepID=A0A2S8F9A7_9BACT|nr:DUF2500 family protein [Blastopirellula marina]PQO28720.1 hypothetical protein C5Y98_23335 [Blastopirellula marina]PTL41993.1 hypothetical protein C5Y97_23345 [Blastopirellula marina]